MLLLGISVVIQSQGPILFSPILICVASYGLYRNCPEKALYDQQKMSGE